MELKIDEGLKAYIDPLTPDEHESLERSILAEGCRDSLVVWGDLLIDGHNRYGICQKHGLPYNTVQATQFKNMDDVHLWMIDQHLGRRSVSDFQRGVLALRKREIIAERRAAAAAAVNAAKAAQPASEEAPREGETDPVVAQALASVAKVPDEALDTREALARAARLSAGQVKMIETIQEKAAPEVVAAVKAGELSLNAAAVVATLPEEEQQAVAAEGADALKQAAKRVRDAKKKPKAAKPETEESAEAAPAASPEELQARVTELEAENERLRMQVKTLQELLAEQG
ncbi:plasmid replication/partition related protein [Comamonas resistens]|uniref:Plasmid replication/partition related protein n=1 Tax=Comamonas resistens TaxID=3046670 RepID=A0ABY8SMY8_9BURK|nr:plasmid replication/partition related protein [Comamonas resistens]MDL5038612.1 plasmid replication/partition related protein [Comamonas resistens]WHS64095.1 plasmid replication/partition related protein [Comamonas resistens]